MRHDVTQVTRSIYDGQPLDWPKNLKSSIFMHSVDVHEMNFVNQCNNGYTYTKWRTLKGKLPRYFTQITICFQHICHFLHMSGGHDELAVFSSTVIGCKVHLKVEFIQ